MAQFGFVCSAGKENQRRLEGSFGKGMRRGETGGGEGREGFGSISV